jgi:uncharacterized protein involved in exopolysaccharide biosynthesis
MDRQIERNRGLNDVVPSERAEWSFFDYGMMIAKRKALIIAITLGAAIIALVYSLTLTNVYTATARSISTEQNQLSMFDLLAYAGPLDVAGSNLAMTRNPSLAFVSMLGSETVADDVIRRFGLEKIYNAKDLTAARDALRERTKIKYSYLDGVTSISVDDDDPRRAADIANGYIEELHKFSQSMAVTEASQRRLFFEQQLRKAKDDLSDAEAAMKAAQEKTGIIELPSQTAAIIRSVAALREGVALKEVQLLAMRSFASERNPNLIRVQREIMAMRVQLANLERSVGEGKGDILIPTNKMPEAGLEYSQRQRNVEDSEAIFNLLAKRYELARMDEARDATLNQVLDYASPPERKSRPKRAYMILLTSFIVGFWSMAGAIVIEVVEHAKA